MRDFPLGVVIVTFNSGGEAVDCAESLLAAAQAAGVRLRVALVDNASDDDTVARLRGWASGETPYAAPVGLPFDLSPVAKPLDLREGGADLAPDPGARLTLLHNAANRGFAGGVNVGLAYLAQFSDIEHFWVLNPDSVVPPEALTALVETLPKAGDYALMGGRVTYLDPSDMIQIDGGKVNMATGVTANIHLGQSHNDTPPPASDELDFIMGASMIASRAFYEEVGPMREEYFLYYEEVDWAMRRGDRPLLFCEGLRIYHHAGSSIGSPTLSRLASPFSLYFKHRGRMMFLRRFAPKRSLLTGYGYTLAYAARLLLRHRAPEEAHAVLAAAFGLRPPASVRARLSGPAAEIAFAAPKRTALL
ncbi:glycosyltransferase family 2 protein [Fluviibacterium sp. DFM31]|uniref:Glycosyltransferase family 2 protein n=1 Tax=Meridianimarinicoccus marinus TaxID=3231483 RepID=A0ABV3L9G6_9RHOB